MRPPRGQVTGGGSNGSGVFKFLLFIGAAFLATFLYHAVQVIIYLIHHI